MFTVLSMTALSDDVGPSTPGICAPHDLPPDSPYALGGEHAVLASGHQPGDTAALMRIMAELHSIATDASRLHARWEGPASMEYVRAWLTVKQEVHALLDDLMRADQVRQRRIGAMFSDWLRHQAQAYALGEPTGPPPYAWMR